MNVCTERLKRPATIKTTGFCCRPIIIFITFVKFDEVAGHRHL